MKYNNPRVKLYKKISTYKETFVNKMKKVKKNTIKKGVNDEYKPSHEPIKPTKQIEALKRFYLISNFQHYFTKITWRY